MSTVASPISEIASMPLPVGVPTPSEPVKARLPIMINDEVLIPEWVADHEFQLLAR